MKIVTTISAVRDQIRQWRQEGLTIGYVPTMGYLHEGHGSLMKAAGENDRVVASIFVNPMQFGPNEDLDSYPRDLEKDAAYCESLGVDLIFHPDAQEMYAPGFCSYVDVNGLTDNLCGASRPVHFRGVCTVVSKFFNIIQPDVAYFGQKDAQQLAVIRRMVKDLNLPLTIVGCPIVREADGLAKSSRNAYLSAQERKAALVLSQSVKLGQALVAQGETDAAVVLAAMGAHIEAEPLATVEYVKAVDGLTMVDTDRIAAPTLVAMAVTIGKTRLIDNFIVE